MKEINVGERVTLEVTETDKESCKGCFFDSKMFYCEAWRKYPCSIKIRSDHKSVIFKEVKESVCCTKQNKEQRLTDTLKVF